MKKIIVLGVVAVFCALPFFNVDGSNESKSWNRILSSEAALRSFCLENSSRAYLGIWGSDEIVAIPGANQMVWVYNEDPIKLIEDVSRQELGIGIISGSNTKISKDCIFFDRRHRVMFQGYAEGKIIETGDSKILAWKDLVMRLPESIEIDLPPEYQYASVYLKYNDSNGYCAYEYISSSESSFYFPTAFAGLEGARLIIRGQTYDGFNLDQVVDLSTGEFLPHDEFFENHQDLKIEGYVYKTDNLVHVVESENSFGENPLFQIDSTGNSSIVFSVKTSEGEIPTGFLYRIIGQEEGGWSDWIRMDYLHGQPYELPAGIYHIYFEWENFRSEKWMNFIPFPYRGDKG